MRSRRRLSLEELAPYLLEVPHASWGTHIPNTQMKAEPIDWGKLFGNTNPVEVEVGFGKGMFLLHAATTQPEVNFLGIEIVRKYALYAATRFAVRKLSNVKVAPTDARIVLGERIPPGSVQAVHVYFPDPWWKKRHHKRRLFTPEFVASVVRVLKEGGRFYVVTDVEDYFGVMKEIVAAMPVFQELPPPDPHVPSHDLDYLTNFERKFRKEGRPIYRAVFLKKIA